ncbi:MAG: ParB/RepB/Spo0J family partition protein [Oscillospiraceae bacterium]|jgi:ParB family chromosome partitioning protein|nr:ParB/RepB/Spo0J family partition protein [Oscillospiraceae bacterium]
MAQKKRGLGTGLDALFGEAGAEIEAAAASSDFEYIPTDRLDPRADQPRQHFDAQALAELADSVRQHGIIVPVVARKTDNGRFELIAGERRWRAALKAGLDKIPVRIIEADTRGVAELSMIENLQRENLNPAEEAAGYKSLAEDFSLTQEEIAARMGKSRPYIANTMRLLELPEVALELVKNGELSSGTARALLPLKNAALIEKTAKEVVANGLTTRAAEALVKKLLSGEVPAKKAAETKNSGYLSDFARELSGELSRKVSVTANNKGYGKLTLEFYGSDDFDALIKRLGVKR